MFISEFLNDIHCINWRHLILLALSWLILNVLGELHILGLVLCSIMGHVRISRPAPRWRGTTWPHTRQSIVKIGQISILNGCWICCFIVHCLHHCLFSLFLEFLFQSQSFLSIILQKIISASIAVRAIWWLFLIHLELVLGTLRFLVLQCAFILFSSAFLVHSPDPSSVYIASLSWIIVIVIRSKVVESQSGFDSLDRLQVIIKFEVHAGAEILVFVDIVVDLIITIIIASTGAVDCQILLHFWFDLTAIL